MPSGPVVSWFDKNTGKAIPIEECTRDQLIECIQELGRLVAPKPERIPFDWKAFAELRKHEGPY
jgi:hypothetical protein